VPDYVDPAIQQQTRLKDLRKSTKRGTVRPENFEQDMKEIGNRLMEIMNGAKLRQIPKAYEKQYKDMLSAITETYRSWRDLDDAMATDIPTEKEALIKSSIEHSKKADRLFKIQRDFFYLK
jgi:DNA-binding ferritin-like protein (Dps family)